MATPQEDLCTPEPCVWDPATPSWVDFQRDDSAFASGFALDDLTAEPSVLCTTGNAMIEKDLVVADLDGDGDEDVLIVRKEETIGPQLPGSKGLSHILLLNQGGVLTEASGLIENNNSNQLPSRDVAVLDIDDDGLNDFVVANTYQSLPRLWRNLGSQGGTFLGFEEIVGFIDDSLCQAAADNCAGCLNNLDACAVATGDINGDGYDDIFVTTYGPAGAAGPSATGDRLYINKGDGSHEYWDISHTVTTGGGNCLLEHNGAGMTTAMIADFDNDTDLDLMRGGPFAAYEVIWNPGVCGTPGCIPSGPWSSRNVAGGAYMAAVWDADGDGDIDLYVSADTADRVAVNPAIGPCPNPQDPNCQDLVCSTPPSTLWCRKPLDDVAKHRKPICGTGNIFFGDPDCNGTIDVGVCDVDIETCPFSGCWRMGLLRNTASAANDIALDDPDNDEILAVSTEDVIDAAFLDLDDNGALGVFQATANGYRFYRQLPFGFGDAIPHSQGDIAVLTSTGTPSLSGGTFDLLVTDAVPGNGHFFFGLAQQDPPGTLGNGLLHAAPPLIRLPIQTSPDGDFALSVDLTQAPFSALGLAPGQSLFFQLYYRDGAAGGAGANTSTALKVMLWP
ncbi:MAG: VCBS repeat-containing protein [Planctomycetota bacterium]